tara:strand:- start:2 stop:544 length:543 start_codon:yes stop_codon:yes gene_type:complete
LDFNTERNTDYNGETWEIQYQKNQGDFLNKLLIRYNDFNDTFEIYFSKNEELKSYLSSLSQDKRTWSPSQKCWVVLPEVASQVIVFSKDLFESVDFSTVPINYQKIFQDSYDTEVINKNISVSNDDVYKILYLIDSAPKSVIKAVYKTLAKEYHPDGGSPNNERFIEIKEAYDSIINRKP